MVSQQLFVFPLIFTGKKKLYYRIFVLQLEFFQMASLFSLDIGSKMDALRPKRIVKQSKRRAAASTLPTGPAVKRDSTETEIDVKTPETTQTKKKPKIQLEKPAWMSDEHYNRQLQSIELTAKSETPTDSESTPAPVPTMASEDVNVKVQYLKNLNSRGKDTIVKEFYNTQTHNSYKAKRTESAIYRLRSFNNCIKYMLIHKYSRHNGSVLDLGCGKGGDLAKWQMVSTQDYVGVDLSDQSVREAVNRYRKQRFPFHAVFATGDFTTPVPEILADFNPEEVSNYQFDNVSMQFCMHYAFANEESVVKMLENISKSLKKGGMFIGTIPSSDFIKWKIKKLEPGAKSWGNSIYSVTFPEEPPKDGKFENPFGNVYSYYLQDAVDNVPEYLVPFEKFRALCEEHHLELRYKKNFFDLFKSEISNYFHMLPGPLIQSLRLDDGRYGVDGDERDACSFYLGFVFEKVA